MLQQVKQWKEPAISIQRYVQERKMKYFECKGEGHQCRDYPNRRKVVHVAMPQRYSNKSREEA